MVQWDFFRNFIRQMYEDFLSEDERKEIELEKAKSKGQAVPMILENEKPYQSACASESIPKNSQQYLDETASYGDVVNKMERKASTQTEGAESIYYPLMSHDDIETTPTITEDEQSQSYIESRNRISGKATSIREVATQCSEDAEFSVDVEEQYPKNKNPKDERCPADVESTVFEEEGCFTKQTVLPKYEQEKVYGEIEENIMIQTTEEETPVETSDGDGYTEEVDCEDAQISEEENLEGDSILETEQSEIEEIQGLTEETAQISEENMDEFSEQSELPSAATLYAELFTIEEVDEQSDVDRTVTGSDNGELDFEEIGKIKERETQQSSPSVAIRSQKLAETLPRPSSQSGGKPEASTGAIPKIPNPKHIPSSKSKKKAERNIKSIEKEQRQRERKKGGNGSKKEDDNFD